MDCFVKYIDTYDDRAVGGEFQREHFIPFTLVSLYGFEIPPSVSEARLLVAVMFEVASDEKRIALSRNARKKQEQFEQEATRVLGKLELEDRPAERAWWYDPQLYYADVQARDQVADLLRRYWRAWDGNWFLCDWPSDPSAVGAGTKSLSRPWRSMSEMRADILRTRNCAVLTFDDNIWDMYVRRELGSALSLVKEEGRRKKIEIKVEQR